MSRTSRSSESKGTRIEDGLSSLVGEYLPRPPKQDDRDGNQDDIDPHQEDRDRVDRERHSRGLELVKGIIEGHETLAVEPDADHIADLIEKKLLHEYDSHEKAAIFSDLYDKLQTRPVLAQKWGILYLLYLLTTRDSGDEAFTDSPAASIEGDATGQTTTIRLPGAHPPGSIPFKARDDIPNSELPRLPSSHRSRSIDSVQTKSSTGRANGRKLEEGVHGAVGEVPSLEQDGSENLLTEAAFLRDLPFTLQGLSTAHLEFTSSSELTILPQLPLPLISLLHTLAEPSLLYRGLSECVQAPVDGMIAQSLTSAIGNELRSYLALVATLEGEIRRSVKTLDGEGRRGNVGRIGVTLKRCVIWTREATLGLRLMSVMIDGIQSEKGGRLISMVHRLSASHGDPFVAGFAERILVHVTKPFYDMLRQWIYDGELCDPYHEFFVAEQDPPKGDPRKPDTQQDVTSNEWDGKYIFDHRMVPTFMTPDLGKKAFLIGKSLNFLRHSCGDSVWVEAYCKDATRELHYGNTATLEKSIDKAYQTTMARLTHLMISKFRLFNHLQALKKYILLGQGDFIALLLECLASNLDQAAGSQYRHVLTGQLENAIRGSNAQYDDEDSLNRLDVKILELSHGDIGWDVFSLEYKVDAPANVVITHGESQKYLKMFNFLWRVKRVEFALGSTWRRCMTGARGALADLDEQMSRDWKAARCCMAEMIHFANHLQYYILFEVIEASWDKLQAAITKPDCTLDDMIEAHSKYLDSITRKGLLGPPRHAITGTREEAFTSQLHHILKTMLAYREAVDGLYTFSVADFTRRQERSAQVVETSAAAAAAAPGSTGLTNRSLNRAIAKSSRGARLPVKERTDSPFPANDILAGASPDESEDQMLNALRVRLGELSKDFRERIATFLGDLAMEPDVNMKFLGVVMNFNNFYEPRRRRRRAFDQKESRKTPEPVAPSPGAMTSTEMKDEKIAKGEKGGGEGGRNGEGGGSRVASRTVAFERLKEKREGKDSDGKSEGSKSDAVGNTKVIMSRTSSRTTSRTTSKHKEERREGSDDDEKMKDERSHAVGNPRISSRKISERPNEKRDGKDDNGKSEAERNHHLVGNHKIASRTTTSERQKYKREEREDEQVGAGANERDSSAAAAAAAVMGNNPRPVSSRQVLVPPPIKHSQEQEDDTPSSPPPPRKKERRRDKG